MVKPRKKTALAMLILLAFEPWVDANPDNNPIVTYLIGTKFLMQKNKPSALACVYIATLTQMKRFGIITDHHGSPRITTTAEKKPMNIDSNTKPDALNER